MNTQTGDPDAQAEALARAREPGWRAKLLVAIVVAAIVAAATFFAIRYVTHCGDCAPPVRTQDV